jgi:hypothetical protein
MPEQQAKDFMGRIIETGDIVCYPVRSGSAMWLNKLTVLALRETPRGICISGMNDAGRRISIHKLSNCVVVN